MRIKQRLNEIIKDDGKMTRMKADGKNFIIFSDIHRGLGDTADDFKKINKTNYHFALNHYAAKDYHLIHLGDIDELKEQWTVGSVLKKNEDDLTFEKKFHQNGKYLRVFGNHDSKYEDADTVKKHLHPYFPGLSVKEAILLEYENFPKIMMVHGHQGYTPFLTSFLEYVSLPFYRLAINIIGKNRDVHYDGYCKIAKIENEFYNWVNEQENMLLIFGHTHKPLWGSHTHVEKIQLEIRDLQGELKNSALKNKVSIHTITQNAAMYGMNLIVDKIKGLIKLLEEKMKEQSSCVKIKIMPALFNSGCCIYDDGDITGIEIEDQEIKLVKWYTDKTTGEIKCDILEREFLGCLRMD